MSNKWCSTPRLSSQTSGWTHAKTRHCSRPCCSAVQSSTPCWSTGRSLARSGGHPRPTTSPTPTLKWPKTNWRWWLMTRKTWNTPWSAHWQLWSTKVGVSLMIRMKGLLEHLSTGSCILTWWRRLITHTMTMVCIKYLSRTWNKLTRLRLSKRSMIK